MYAGEIKIVRNKIKEQNQRMLYVWIYKTLYIFCRFVDPDCVPRIPVIIIIAPRLRAQIAAPASSYT